MTASKALTSRLTTFLARMLPQASPLESSPAGRLLESASARSGLNPQQARELRLAACAYLSVVR